MKKIFYLYSKSLLSKLALMAILIVGGSNFAWGEGEYIGTLTFSSGETPSGWSVENNKFSGDYIEPSQSWYVLKISSSSKIKLIKGQKIVITAKRTADTNYFLKYYYYSNSLDANNPKANFSTSTSFPSLNTDCTLTIDITSDIDTYYIGFWMNKVSIKSIEFKAAEAAEEITELTFDESTDIPEGFSTLTSATSIPDIYVKYTPVNGWNTICMPFSLKGNVAESEMMSTIFGSDWEAYAMSSYSDGVITFSKRTSSLSMYANNPYLVYTQNAQEVPQEGFHFENVNVTYNSNPKSTQNSAIFQGTYTGISMYDKYGLTPSGKIMKGGENSTLKGFRAYFTNVAPPTGGSRLSIVIEDEEGGTTDLGFVKMVDPEAQDVYTLSGQKVKKGSKGIYIVNGRKVVIK